LPTISYRQHLEDAFRLLQEKSAPAVAVVDAARRLVGLVTPETVGEMLMLHEALPQGCAIAAAKPTGGRLTAVDAPKAGCCDSRLETGPIRASDITSQSLHS
jgi:CBS-domain-containing membrane protein